ncbi:cytochrome P450 [Roridomyces roridus]|uniref:Cytochrome P450 n=1 Tax=Roridomyces roridus TaxID=1738132 RepID=A0AAD7F8V9_9AGAR|nr:cytochrome P450 [Roridomyces roridus]
MILHTLFLAAFTPFFYALFRCVCLLHRELTSPLRHVSGPRSPSLLFGNFKDVMADFDLPSKWRAQFGRTFRFRGLFSVSELHTSDLKALHHVLNDSIVYRKAPFQRESVRRLLGDGVSAASSLINQRQRMWQLQNPAFGPARIRLLTPIFLEKALKLRDIWAASLVSDSESKRNIDVMDGVRRMTLDVIGEAGFHYQFNALEHKSNELAETFTQLMHSPNAQKYQAVRIAQGMVPILRFLPLPGSHIVARARIVMDSIGGQIVADSKASLLETETGTAHRDLISVLLNANLRKDVPQSQRMKDSEVVAQIPAIFLAGHETSSSAIAWALHELTVHPEMQIKLRDEVLKVSSETPTMDEVNSLHYLECFVRETMRLHAPAVFTTRMAMKDDLLPLSSPYTDRRGNAHESLRIPAGQIIHIPILAVNTDKETWGDDALEFRPERWDDLPEAVSALPGVWANLLTFYAGAHTCIGFRFAIVEVKVLLFTLLRAFEFAPAVPTGGVVPKLAGVLQRPSLLLPDKKGAALPMVVRPYDRN